jgi:hypothetical protein
VNLHYYISYLALSLSIITLLSFAIKTNIIKISKIVFSCFYILLLAQIIDLIITGGSDLTYLIPKYHKNLILRYFTFFGKMTIAGGVTIGMKTELIIVLILNFYYLKLFTKNIFKSLFFTWMLYNLFFLYGLTPTIIQKIKSLFCLSINETQIDYITYFSIMSFVLLIWNFRKIKRGKNEFKKI